MRHLPPLSPGIQTGLYTTVRHLLSGLLMSSLPGPHQRFFTREEFAFVTAVVQRLLPEDGFGPSGMEAGVPIFIDAQLIGALGRAPSVVPGASFSQAFRRALASMQIWIGECHGSPFDGLPAAKQDDVLRFVETAAELSFDGVPAPVLFETFLNLAKAGYLQCLVNGQGQAHPPTTPRRHATSHARCRSGRHHGR
jgi:hypothetical protein